MEFPKARIAVFAREPEAGRVKTRLQPELGEQGALRLYRAMLARTMETLSGAALAPFSLWVTADPRHPGFADYRSAQSVLLQRGNDLGARMAHCGKTLFAAGADSVLIIGTDCPALKPDYLAAALGKLADGADVVLGPAEDGGYVLVGLRREVPRLFTGIDWGTDRVLTQSLARLELEGLDYDLLPALWDVDRPEDLQRLQSLQPPLSWE